MFLETANIAFAFTPKIKKKIKLLKSGKRKTFVKRKTRNRLWRMSVKRTKQTEPASLYASVMSYVRIILCAPLACCQVVQEEFSPQRDRWMREITREGRLIRNIFPVELYWGPKQENTPFFCDNHGESELLPFLKLLKKQIKEHVFIGLVTAVIMWFSSAVHNSIFPLLILLLYIVQQSQCLKTQTTLTRRYYFVTFLWTKYSAEI